MDKALLVAGAALFLVGLVQGAVVQEFANPRMALSAHLTAAQSGTALMVAGGVWRAVSLHRHLLRATRWSLVGGMVGLWLGLTLAAVTGASRMLPIAGRGFSASASEELAVSIIVVGSGALTIKGWALLLVGLLRRRAD
ncbi:hypothetical protein AAW00_01460 [Aurantiacibacter luteus]|uniref:Hydrogenase n=2 Tax=Aurantiacibacter luteus TaxID=1581420 RepID=A0A0G9MWN2_9SPHN|nr:hypothetical protein AAW00_01460 [Aurantiacibacter luteus]